jgi:hypothetical protein
MQYPAWRAEATYREIERKIGEELRKFYEPSKELPHSLLALLMQINEESGEK